MWARLAAAWLFCFLPFAGANAQLSVTGVGGGFGGGGGGGVTLVQKAGGTPVNASATITATFGAGITAGSIIVVEGMWENSTQTITSLSDGLGDTATDSGKGIVRDSTTTGSQFVEAFLTPTAGATTITLVLNGAPQTGALVIYEVAGLTTKAFDQVVTTAATGSSAVTAVTAALATPNEFAIGLAMCTGICTATNTNITPGTSTFDFGITGNAGGTINYWQAAHLITSATSALTASVLPAGFSGNLIWAVTFK